MSQQSPATRPLRHAIVGVGAAVLGMHQSAFSLPTFQLVGVTDVNRAAAEERAESLGCPVFPDAATMIEQARPEVVVIMTPHPFHAELTIAALEAGCHALCEKPMAVHAGEADAMIAAAARTGRLLAVNLQFRHRPEVIAAKRLLDEGRLGQLQRVDVLACWTRAERYYRQTPWRGTWKGEGGGVLMNQAPHNLDLACHLAGPPSRVAAWTRTRSQPIQAEDTAHAMLEWPGGALGSIHVSTAEADTGDRIELLGTGGRMTIRPGSLEVELFEPDLRQHLRETDVLWSSPKATPLPVSLPLDRAAYASLLDELRADE